MTAVCPYLSVQAQVNMTVNSTPSESADMGMSVINTAGGTTNFGTVMTAVGTYTQTGLNITPAPAQIQIEAAGSVAHFGSIAFYIDAVYVLFHLHPIDTLTFQEYATTGQYGSLDDWNFEQETNGASPKYWNSGTISNGWAYNGTQSLYNTITEGLFGGNFGIISEAINNTNKMGAIFSVRNPGLMKQSIPGIC